MSIYVKLTPPAVAELGHTDEAAKIGRGLVREAADLLKRAAEAEGFVVDIECNMAVY